jgi:hypothetical protein
MPSKLRSLVRIQPGSPIKSNMLGRPKPSATARGINIRVNAGYSSSISSSWYQTSSLTMPTDDRRTLKAASSGNHFTSRTTGPFSAGPLYWSAGAARIPTFSHVLIAGASTTGKTTSTLKIGGVLGLPVPCDGRSVQSRRRFEPEAHR